MQTEQIKNKIKMAIDAVSDVEEPFKIKAFEVILSKLLEESEEMIHHLATPSPKSTTQGNLKGAKTLERIASFAKRCNLNAAQLRDAIEFKEDVPMFIEKVEGSDAEKQVKASQCLLATYENVYQRDWIEASTLRQNLADSGVPLANLARSLKSQKEIFRKIGKKKNTKYKLTGLGKKKAYQLIRKLATV